MKQLRRFGAICALLALVGCASPYAPYLADDAGKVRITLATTSSFSTLTANLRPVVDEKCGPPVRFQQLSPYVEPRRDQIDVIQRFEPAQTYPRAAMVGSTDPARSDAVELQLPPGRYLFSQIGVLGSSICAINAAIDIDPTRQYEIEFRIDGNAGKCDVGAKRLEEQGGRSQWRPYGFVRGEVCTK